MRIGIVGHEAAKFTPETEAKAREVIRFLLADPHDVLISGHCHLGGIDIWAEEEARKLHRGSSIFAPMSLTWEDQKIPGTNFWASGFKSRNMQIAKQSDIVHCLVVRELPPTYEGMTFNTCYHCKGRIETHVKSGGCWTAWRCKNHQWWVL